VAGVLQGRERVEAGDGRDPGVYCCVVGVADGGVGSETEVLCDSIYIG
jgi:hypothetical protein